MAVRPGLSAQLDYTVGTEDTAERIGSGTVPMLATPRLLAWAEAATLLAVRDELDAADTSVGTAVQLQHLKATPIGGRITVRAELTAVEGRTLRFRVSAEDGDAQTVFWGSVSRVVVDRERFLAGG